MTEYLIHYKSGYLFKNRFVVEQWTEHSCVVLAHKEQSYIDVHDNFLKEREERTIVILDIKKLGE